MSRTAQQVFAMLLAAISIVAIAVAQTDSSAATPTVQQKDSGFLTKLTEALGKSAKDGEPGRKPAERDELMERIWCGDVTDATTRDLCWKSYQARMSYYIGAMEHRSRVFWWQHTASRIIFVVVIGLVSVGVYFAWVQFRKGLASPTGDVPASQFEFAATGMKISSPVLGLIILVVSLAFFYLYLTHVFPVSETF